MKLYYAEVLNPRKVCALAKHLQAPVDYIRVELAKGEHFKPAFRALNPNGKVPVLEDDGAILWEADAIMCHLALRVRSDLWPSDRRQAEVLRWLSWNQVHFQRYAATYYFERVVKRIFGLGPPDDQLLADAEKPLRRSAKILDAHLADRAFLLGDTLTIADFSTAITLPFMDEAQLPFGDYPAILRWRDRMDKIEAWRDPYPAQAKAA